MSLPAPRLNARRRSPSQGRRSGCIRLHGGVVTGPLERRAGCAGVAAETAGKVNRRAGPPPRSPRPVTRTDPSRKSSARHRRPPPPARPPNRAPPPRWPAHTAGGWSAVRGAGGRFEAAAGLIEQRYTPCPEVQLRVRPLHGCLTYFNGASGQIWFGSRAGCLVALRGIIPEEVMIKHFADADDKDSKEPYSCVLIPLLPPFSLSLSPDV